MLSRVLLVTSIVAGGAAAQAPPDAGRGAKAIFVDPQSGARVPPATVRGSAHEPQTHTRHPRRAGVASQATEVKVARPGAGLHYYVELIGPTGEGRRVNINQVFRSGDRIRLHFISNAAGRLALFQRRKDGTADMLFPHAQLVAGNDRIRAGEDAVVPPGDAWLRFDEQPGVEHLVVMFAADDLSDPVRFPAVGTTLSASAADSLTTGVRACRGSKDLMLETAPEGTYLVGASPGGCRLQGSKDLALELGPSARAQASTRPGSFTVATEIELRHAP